eukprot:TRINITY_DN3946_c0_g1_i1.p1 TRINITY_DN3946_c0_g1~~TRINITY_DN3946_c0_g1_i1.p1  ORF type:complete len:342 (+),score=54.89 TRINITY_DN3946_c0_g1_i1:75-1100(+)
MIIPRIPFLLVLFVFLAFLVNWFVWSSKQQAKTLHKGNVDLQKISPPEEDEFENLTTRQFTLLFNGYLLTRQEFLFQMIATYSRSALVQGTVIIWSNLEPPTVNFTLATKKPVTIVDKPTSSLNNRFDYPVPELRTRALLVIDDDIEISLSEMEFAFKVWQEFPDRIVGMFPRYHRWSEKTRSWKYTNDRRIYSMILTKFMFLDVKYLKLYTHGIDQRVRDYVNRENNCEDIAMNFVVAEATRKGPILIDGMPKDWGDKRSTKSEFTKDAIGSKKGHKDHRSECLDYFATVWGYMPLVGSIWKVSADVGEFVLCKTESGWVECGVLTKSNQLDDDKDRIVF